MTTLHTLTDLHALLDAMQARCDAHVDAMDGREDRWFMDLVNDNICLIATARAVLTLAEAWRYKGEYGDGPWQLGEGPDESGEALDYAASQLRAATRAALIGDDDD